MTTYIILLSILGISALSIAVIERKRRVARESRKLDEALFRRVGRNEQ